MVFWELGSGFYLATFFRLLAKEDSTETLRLVLPGPTTAKNSIGIWILTGGFYLGKQWMLAHRIYIDWRILGGSYGRAKGALAAKVQLRNGEQEAIDTDIAGLIEEFPVIRFAPRIHNQGIFVDIEFFWVGLRTGLFLGLLL